MSESAVQEAVWTGDEYLGVISILMIFKAKRLREITNGVNVIGEERKPRGTRKDHQRKLSCAGGTGKKPGSFGCPGAK